MVGAHNRETNVSYHQGTATASVAYVRDIVAKDFEHSTVSDNTGSYPTFDLDELKLGKELGRGGFSTVWEVRAFYVDETNDPPSEPGSSLRSLRSMASSFQSIEQDMESRKFIARHCLRGENGDARYAAKMLSKETIRSDKEFYLTGILDIAIEVRFLSDIEHPNIVKLRALPPRDPFHPNYFLVMDRLFDTLECRLRKWKGRASRYKGLVGFLSDRKSEKTQELYIERIVFAYDLAAAIDYLHKRNIVYRDIKPENVGFDCRDDIKIFDFGLAKELHEISRNEDGTYKLTPFTGSMRFMAPEVANSLPYNATCDTYSFSLLLWQMLVLEEPFKLYTRKGFREKIYNGPCKRPPIPRNLSKEVSFHLKQGWCQNLHQRNTMEQWIKVLKNDIVRAREGDESDLTHHRRRSTFIFDPTSPSSYTGTIEEVEA